MAMYVVFAFLATSICANLHIWAKAVTSMFVSQAKQLRRSIKQNEGAPLTALGAEVALMADMVKVSDND